MIIIPARNEGPRIGAVIECARQTCPNVPIVVVVNGCTDDTASIAEHMGATVLESAPGYGHALLTAYRHAASTEGLPWLVQLDADGQHPADAIPLLLRTLDQADVVIGSRFAEGGTAEGWRRRRRWAILAMGLATRWMSGLNVMDVTSGFQAFRPEVVDVLAQQFDPKLTDANVLVRLSRCGFVVRECGVNMGSRKGGVSMHGGLQSAIYAGKTLMAVSQEIRA